MKVEENRAAMVFNGWSDHRIGADLLCYMNGYQDPRREKMFTQVEITETVGGKPTKVSGFAGIRIGIDVVNKESVIDRYSKPIISTASPYPWMNAAEITFLRAEGALRGWAMGAMPRAYIKKQLLFLLNSTDFLPRMLFLMLPMLPTHRRLTLTCGWNLFSRSR